MDEFLNKVVFIYLCVYIVWYDVMVYSYRVWVFLYLLYCIWIFYLWWWMGYVGCMRNCFIKVINGFMWIFGCLCVVCFWLNFLLKKDFFVFLFILLWCFERLFVLVFVIVDIIEYRLFIEMYIICMVIWFRFICVCGVLFFMDCLYKEMWCKNCE